jgi:hypothetical protein
LDVHGFVLIGGRFLAECCANAGLASRGVCIISPIVPTSRPLQPSEHQYLADLPDQV